MHQFWVTPGLAVRLRVIVQSRSSAVDRAAGILTRIVRGALLLLVLGFAVLFASVTALRRRAWM